MNKRLVALLSGNVYNVGLKEYIRNKAMELGLSGSVEYTSDGRVEVTAEGPKEDLSLLVKFLWQGSRESRIEELELDWGEAAGMQGFVVH